MTQAYRGYVQRIELPDVQYHEYDFHAETKGMKSVLYSWTLVLLLSDLRLTPNTSPYTLNNPYINLSMVCASLLLSSRHKHVLRRYATLRLNRTQRTDLFL